MKEANHQDQKRFSCGVLNNKFRMIKVGDRNWVGQAPRQCLSQGVNLTNTKESVGWVFLKDPKNILSEKQNPKK